ncbi:MAG: DUF6788 family protein [Candidatus Hodarchaeota archaeon]
MVAKLQRCGKTNCHCYAGGTLHGPYFWLVVYVRSESGRGKYQWKYLGKSANLILAKLKDLGVSHILPKEKLDSKVLSLKKKALFPENNSKRNFSGKILSFEHEDLLNQF